MDNGVRVKRERFPPGSDPISVLTPFLYVHLAQPHFCKVDKDGGVIVHDCWASYFSDHQSEDALCGSHLLRDLEFVIDSNGYVWAKNMKKLLKETCAKVSRRKRKKLTENDYLITEARNC